MDVAIGDLTLPNPVMTASGTAGYGSEGLPYLAPADLGAFVTKGLSMKPRAGNPPPRTVETAAGMLNAIGLENIGVEAFAQDHLPTLCSKGARVIVNFFGETEEEYVKTAHKISVLRGVQGLEMNVSCPNIQKGGRTFGRDPEVLYRLVQSVRKETPIPLIVKLTPDASDILETAQAAWEGGCDALTVANTYRGLVVDVRGKKPKLSIGSGGLSGPAIRPLTVYRVWLVSQRAPVPVIGVGGITSAQDALEYLIAGATAIQVGTGAFINPKAPVEIIQGIKDYLAELNHTDVREIVGSLQGMPELVEGGRVE